MQNPTILTPHFLRLRSTSQSSILSKNSNTDSIETGSYIMENKSLTESYSTEQMQPFGDNNSTITDLTTNDNQSISKKKPTTEVANTTISPDGWVTLSLRCIPWRYLNFSLRVKVDTSIEMIQMKIIEHHDGTVSNITMFKNKVNKDNLLPNEDARNKTLMDFGIRGGTFEENVEMIIYYDYEPFKSGNQIPNLVIRIIPCIRGPNLELLRNEYQYCHKIK